MHGKNWSLNNVRKSALLHIAVLNVLYNARRALSYLQCRTGFLLRQQKALAIEP